MVINYQPQLVLASRSSGSLTGEPPKKKHNKLNPWNLSRVSPPKLPQSMTFFSLPETNELPNCPWKSMVGRSISFWEALFSWGAISSHPKVGFLLGSPALFFEGRIVLVLGNVPWYPKRPSFNECLVNTTNLLCNDSFGIIQLKKPLKK